MSSEATDQELLAAFYSRDDDDALAIFVERHRSWALTQAAQFFAEEAEDVVQLSILRLPLKARMCLQSVSTMASTPPSLCPASNTMTRTVARAASSFWKSSSMCARSLHSLSAMSSTALNQPSSSYEHQLRHRAILRHPGFWRTRSAVMRPR